MGDVITHDLNVLSQMSNVAHHDDYATNVSFITHDFFFCAPLESFTTEALQGSYTYNTQKMAVVLSINFMSNISRQLKHTQTSCERLFCKLRHSRVNRA